MTPKAPRIVRAYAASACLIGAAILFGQLGGSVPAIAAGEAEPPPCVDERYVAKIKTQYEFADAMKDGRTIKTVDGIEELHYGPSPEALNKYATETNRAVNSRYCAAKLVLDDGSADSLFWRMDYVQDGEGHSINYDHCSDKHDTFQDKCSDYRAGK